jgi:hypothetical protein
MIVHRHFQHHGWYKGKRKEAIKILINRRRFVDETTTTQDQDQDQEPRPFECSLPVSASDNDGR